MPKHKSRQLGFTIVELLIVIVVIAILATISIVAYSGIQNRANDSAVQSNLRNIGMKISQYHAEFDSYPANTAAAMDEFVKVSKNSYMLLGNSFGYCQIAQGPDQRFSIVGRSASGTGYYFSSVDGLREMAGWSAGNATLCPMASVDSSDPNYRFLWIHVNNAWASWVD